jgi:predicted Zn-dependent protease
VRPLKLLLLGILAFALWGLAGPAGAALPQPVALPGDLAPDHQAQLSRQRAALDTRWDRLVAKVQKHNQKCRQVPAGSPQAGRCSDNMARLRGEITAYAKAVEAFNQEVAATPRAAAAKPGAQRGLISQETEVKIGRKVAASIESKAVMVKDPLATYYVGNLGQRMARLSGRPGLTYSFKLIRAFKPSADKGLKGACGLACAAPGGFIFVHKHLFKDVENESELAGVLAHEVGHVASRHGAKRIYKLAKSAGIAVAGGALLGPAGMFGPLSQKFLFDMAYYKYTRDEERQADRQAVETLLKAGIKPTGLITFFEKRRRRKVDDKGYIEKFYATHPSAQERIKLMEPLLADPRFNKARHLDSAQFQKVRAKLIGP